MRARLAVAAAVAVLGTGATPAGAASVAVEFQEFRPSPLDVLPGETVEWLNVSERRHTVTADDESFDSGDIFGGDRFEVTFAEVGAYPYHCTVHPGMTGEVNVRRVTLGVLPVELVPAGQTVEVDGRSADPSSPVRIERSSGGGFETVATAIPGPDGTWRTEVVAERTADYRAVSDLGVSQTRRLRVSDRRLIVRARPGRVIVRVVPPAPYARINLELRLRDRFGWWPEERRRLDYLSRASFRVRGPVRARVALVERDGWTHRALSDVVRVPRPRSRRAGDPGQREERKHPHDAHGTA